MHMKLACYLWCCTLSIVIRTSTALSTGELCLRMLINVQIYCMGVALLAGTGSNESKWLETC